MEAIHLKRLHYLITSAQQGLNIAGQRTSSAALVAELCTET